MALSPADTADFQSSVLRRRDIDPHLAPTRWLKGLQRAIYDWAQAVGKVWALRFRHYRLRARPAEQTPPSKSPQPPFPARSMLPSVGQFTAAAQSMLGNSVAVGHTLKRSLVALGEARRQQSLRDIKRRALRRTQETRNLRRIPGAVAGSATQQPGPPAGYHRNPIGQQGAPKPQGDLVCPVCRPNAAPRP